MNREIIVVAGPTAVGKTEYAINTALHFNGEIISCDSMQLYKYLDIGSAKPTLEEQQRVKHYLVDEIDPKDNFSVAKYQTLAKAAIEEVFAKEKTPVIAGGTGLYLNSLLYDMDFSAPPKDNSLRQALYAEAFEHGSLYIYDKLVSLDPESADRIHPNNIKKVVRAIEAATLGSKVKDFNSEISLTSDYKFQLIGLSRNREELYNRINKRVDVLIESGLLNEVSKLLDQGLTANDISMKGIGYKEIIGYFNHEYSLDEVIELVKRNTRHLAKRQMTWFRRYKDMKWFNISDYSSDEKCLEDIYRWLQKK